MCGLCLRGDPSQCPKFQMGLERVQLVHSLTPARSCGPFLFALQNPYSKNSRQIPTPRTYRGNVPRRPAFMDNQVTIETSRKLAAQRQIDGAIAHLCESELECAITLAGAAEEVLPDTNEPEG